MKYYFLGILLLFNLVACQLAPLDRDLSLSLIKDLSDAVTINRHTDAYFWENTEVPLDHQDSIVLSFCDFWRGDHQPNQVSRPILDSLKGLVRWYGQVDGFELVLFHDFMESELSIYVNANTKVEQGGILYVDCWRRSIENVSIQDWGILGKGLAIDLFYTIPLEAYYEETVLFPFRDLEESYGYCLKHQEVYYDTEEDSLVSIDDYGHCIENNRDSIFLVQKHDSTQVETVVGAWPIVATSK